MRILRMFNVNFDTILKYIFLFLGLFLLLYGMIFEVLVIKIPFYVNIIIGTWLLFSAFLRHYKTFFK